MVERKEYLDTLILSKDTNFIKVITGIRRCGKSTVLQLYKEYLVKTGVPDKNIILLNFEDFNLDHLLTAKALHNYIEEQLVDDKQQYYLIFDEIQLVENFPRAIDSLYIKKNTDVYISGSNANLLSSDIATLLSGRYIEIEMMPLSFKEYTDATKRHNNLPLAYQKYNKESSFPHVLELQNNEKMISLSLEGVYNSIIVKDITTRYQIRDMTIFESVANFVLDNIGNIVSTKKISDVLTSAGRKSSVTAIERYLDALTSSFIIYNCTRYDIKGRQYLKTLSKYYVVDIGLRQTILQKSGGDVGRILENNIYLELIRRGYQVYIGVYGDFEIDFVAQKQGETLYFQVAATIRDEETLKRELRPLQKIKDSHPKYILTLDEDPSANYEGIITKNALEWLYNRE